MTTKRTLAAYRVEQLLAQKGWKPADLSRASGVSEGAISNALSGKRQPSSETLTKWARVLDCSVDYLLGITDDPTTRDLELDDLLWELTQVAQSLPRRRQRDLLLMARAYLEAGQKQQVTPEQLERDLLELIAEAGGTHSREQLIELLEAELGAGFPALEDGEQPT